MVLIRDDNALPVTTRLIYIRGFAFNGEIKTFPPPFPLVSNNVYGRIIAHLRNHRPLLISRITSKIDYRGLK